MDRKVPDSFHALYDRGFRAARGALPTPSAQAETVGHEREDLPEVWAGFPKPGMGVDAVPPPSSSTSLAGVVESFNTP